MSTARWIILGALSVGAALAQPPAESGKPAEAPNASSASYAISWITTDANGGGKSSSTDYRIALTIGQSPAGVATSAQGQAHLGFWAVSQLELFRDGFESGDTSAWSSTVGGT